MALSNEINNLVSKSCNDFQHSIADKKIKQLTLLTRANSFLYMSVAFYVYQGYWELLLKETRPIHSQIYLCI